MSITTTTEHTYIIQTIGACRDSERKRRRLDSSLLFCFSLFIFIHLVFDFDSRQGEQRTRFSSYSSCGGDVITILYTNLHHDERPKVSPIDSCCTAQYSMDIAGQMRWRLCEWGGRQHVHLSLLLLLLSSLGGGPLVLRRNPRPCLPSRPPAPLPASLSLLSRPSPRSRPRPPLCSRGGL